MESPANVFSKEVMHQGSCRWLVALVFVIGASTGAAQFMPSLHEPGAVRSTTWHLGQNLIGQEEAGMILPGFVGNMSVIGDLDANGVPDLVFGVPGSGLWGNSSPEDSADAKGSIHVLLMHSKDSVLTRVRIGDGDGGFTAMLDSMDLFGAMVSGIGDVNGDDIPDLAVLAPGDDDGDEDLGAIYILFMDPDGSVDSQQKISATSGGFLGDLENGNRFSSLGRLGDMNADGIPDLAVGSANSQFGLSGIEYGAVWVLLLDSDGTVKDHWLLSVDSTWPNGNPIDNEDPNFGHAVVGMGDINGDGFNDIAVSSFDMSTAGDTVSSSFVHILLLDTTGHILGNSRIAPGVGGLSEALGHASHFGISISTLPDMNQDGKQELLISAPFYGMPQEGLNESSQMGGMSFGAIAILFLTDSGTVAHEAYIQDRHYHGAPVLSLFGLQVAAGVDLNNDSIPDLCTVIYQVPSSGNSEPIWAIQMMHLEQYPFPTASGNCLPDSLSVIKEATYMDGTNDSSLPWEESGFGHRVAGLGDLSHNGLPDIAIGHPNGNAGGQIHLVMATLTEGLVTKVIGEEEGGFSSDLNEGDRFGEAIAAVGDINGDGIMDIAVLAPGDNDGENNGGAVYILFMNIDGSVLGEQKISALEGEFTGDLSNGNAFKSVGRVGDLDGDGIPDLAVGAYKFNSSSGAVWFLHLNSNGTVKSHWHLSSESEWPTSDPAGDSGTQFGWAVEGLGDLSGSGTQSVAISSFSQLSPSVHIVELNTSGVVVSLQTIHPGSNQLTSSIYPYLGFGCSLTNMGDLNGDGVNDLAISAPLNYADGAMRGAVVVVQLNEDGTVLCDEIITHGTLMQKGPLEIPENTGFGFDIAKINDINFDGVPDLVVTAPYDLLGSYGIGDGRLYFLAMEGVPIMPHSCNSGPNGEPSFKRLSMLDPTNTEELPWNEGGFGFGLFLAPAGDVNGDGFADIAVGHPLDSETPHGSVYLLMLDADQGVQTSVIIASGHAGFTPALDSAARFGVDVMAIGDLDGDGIQELAVLCVDPGNITSPTSILVLFLDDSGTVRDHQVISATQGGFTGEFGGNNYFLSLGKVGDMNGDGIPDLGVGAMLTKTDDSNQGAFWILLLDHDGTVKEDRFYSSESTWPEGSPIQGENTFFGMAISGLGDVNGDGHPDIAVSAPNQLGGTVHVILLDDAGAIVGNSIIRSGAGGLQSTLSPSYFFGASLAGIGDINGDGIGDLVAAAPVQYSDTMLSGAIVLMHLNADGSVLCDELIEHGTAIDSTTLELDNMALFGLKVAALGDIDGDRVMDLAVGAPGLMLPNKERGRIHLFHLNGEAMEEEPQVFSVRITVQEESPDSLGHVSLSVRGGNAPYTIAWGEKFPTREEYAMLQGELAPAVNDPVGTSSLDISSLSYDSLALLSMPEDGLVPAGIYHIHVTDSSGVRISSVVYVGNELSLLESVNGNFDDDRNEFTVTDEYGQSMAVFTNILPQGYTGWVNFSIPDAGQLAAVALFSIESDTSSLEEALLSALVVSDTMAILYTVESESEHYFEHIRTNDYLIYIDSVYAKFYINNILITSALIDERLGDVHLLMVLGNDGRIANISSNFLNTPWNTASIQHLAPLAPASGNIELGLADTYGPHQVEWAHDETTEESVGGLSPGTYSSTIASDYFGTSKTFHHVVGHEILADIPEGYAPEQTQGGVGVRMAAKDSLAYWGAMVRSENMVDKGAEHWVSFKPDLEQWQEHAAVLGLSADADSAMWAGWRVHVMGGLMIAQAIGRSGVLARAVIRNRDELTIQLDSAMVTFLHNGKPVHSFERPIEGPSRLAGALFGEGARILDAHTSIPVPLKLNTQYLPGDLDVAITTPGEFEAEGTTGEDLVVEMERDLPTGPYTLFSNGLDSLDSTTLLFALGKGGVNSVNLLLEGDTIEVDPELYETVGNQWILYTGPERYEELPDMPFAIAMEQGVRITPDDDDQFDEFKPVLSAAVGTYELSITNSLGALMYQTTDPDVGWNGKFMNTGGLVEIGIYDYQIIIDEALYTGQFLLAY